MTLFKHQTWIVTATIDQDTDEGFVLADITTLLQDAANSGFLPNAVHGVRVELGPSTMSIGDET
jgi:hypothetical protein